MACFQTCVSSNQRLLLHRATAFGRVKRRPRCILQSCAITFRKVQIRLNKESFTRRPCIAEHRFFTALRRNTALQLKPWQVIKRLPALLGTRFWSVVIWFLAVHSLKKFKTFLSIFANSKETVQMTIEIRTEHPVALIFFTLLVVGLLFLHNRFYITHDPREPPVIRPRFLVIDHGLGLLRWGTKYFKIVNAPYHYPIFTLPIFGNTVYVATTATMARVVQHRTLPFSFFDVVLDLTGRFVGLDKQSMRIMQTNADGFDGPHGLMPETRLVTAKLLRPGPDLDALSVRLMDAFTHTLCEIAPEGPQQTGLWTWIGHHWTVANAHAVYGPDHIFANSPGLVPSFWAFEAGLLPLATNPVPRLTVRTAYKGREAVVAAMIEYLKSGRYHQASPLVTERIAVSEKYGLSTTAIARAELMQLFALAANATPTIFWLLSHIFSQPALLASVRKEVEEAMSLAGESEKDVRCFSAEDIKRRCPLLVSTYRETLRSHAHLAWVRFACEDIELVGGYILKKGSTVHVAGGLVHMDENVWGAEAGEFKADRFLAEQEKSLQHSSSEDEQKTYMDEGYESGEKKEEEEEEEEEKPATRRALMRPKTVPTSAFQAFGGGRVICPGRHYALLGVVGFTAAMVAGFDITNQDGTTLTLPENDECKLPLGVMKPRGDPPVTIRRRSGTEHVKWILKL